MMAEVSCGFPRGDLPFRVACTDCEHSRPSVPDGGNFNLMHDSARL